jgi:hypothetical protein
MFIASVAASKLFKLCAGAAVEIFDAAKTAMPDNIANPRI